MLSRIIDSGGGTPGGGHGLSRVVNQFPAAVISLSEQIENATGVNILSSLGKVNGASVETSSDSAEVEAEATN